MNDAAAAKSSVDVALEALKPIRDIVKNWDIDISSCLEEFLRELVGDKHAHDAMLIERGVGLDGDEQQQQQHVDGGSKQVGGFSFTNAALVLDSSSRVYSRKVEYLHQLVFKALDGLAASSSSQAAGGAAAQKKKRARAAASPEILEFQAFDPMEEFLLLDDVLPTDEAEGCRHINLPSEQHHINNNKKETTTSGPWNSVEIARRRAGGGSGGQSSASRQSLSMVNRTAGGGNNNNSTFANNNNNIMNRSSVGSAALQALVGSAASGTAGHSSLRLMRMHGCTIDAAGALVMPGQRQQQQQHHHQTPANNNAASTRMSYPAMSSGKKDIVGGLDDHDDDDNDGPGFAMTDDDDHDDDDDGGPGYAMVDNDTAAMPPPSTRKKGVTFCDDLPSHKRGEHAQKPAQAKDEEDAEQEEEEEDPWKLLDPHVAATEKKHKPRPLVVGMTLQLPPGVNELPSEAIARARNSTRENGAKRKKLVVPRIKEKKDKNNATFCNRTWAVDTFRANLKRAQQAGQQQQQPSLSSSLEELGEDGNIDQPPPIPLTGLFYGNEFEYIARATAKRKAAERREMLQQQEREQSQQQRQQKSRNRQDADGNVHSQQSSDAEIMHHDNNNNNDDYDDDDGGFGFAMGDHDDGDDNDDVDFGGTGFDDDNDTSNNNNNKNDGKPKEVVTNTGLTLVDQAYQTTADDDNDSAMNDRHFAALCRARIESFAKGAEKYASDTNLSKRVEKWQSKVKPMLEDEERRPVFDIHAYSQRILASMEHDLESQRAAKDDENMNEDDAMILQEKGNPLVDFAAVTQDCEQYDVCRMFLASLSLCNAGNIDLRQIDSNKPNDDDGRRPRLGTLRMELLKSDISQPIDTYLDFGN